MRRAVLLVGPCGSGKSLVVRMAAELLTIVQSPLVAKIEHVFVDAVPFQHLFGYFAADNRTWRPGLLERLVQQTAEESEMEDAAKGDASFGDDARPVQRVVVLDCSAESLALEDVAPLLAHGVAHLPNGAMVQAAGPIAFACETETLAGLSPALLASVPCVPLTVPVLDPTIDSVRKDLSARSTSFSEHNEKQGAEFLHSLATWAFQELKSLSRVGPMHAVLGRACQVMQSIYEATYQHASAAKAEALPDWAIGIPNFSRTDALSCCALVYGAVWAIGGCLTPDEGQEFESRVRDTLPSNFCRVPPPSTSLFHSMVDGVALALVPIPPHGPDTSPVVRMHGWM